VFVLRPLLGIGRADLRTWLTERGENWIDDPANEDQRFARARARQFISAHPGESRGPGLSREHRAVKDLGPGFGCYAPLLRSRRDERWGVLRFSRDALEEADIAAACLCAAGTTRPPRGDRLTRLTQRLTSAETFTATLAGARIEASPTEVVFMRDAGETARGGLPPIHLTPNEPTVWDGRFEITAPYAATVAPLKGHAAGLPKPEREALRAVPAAARPALPILITSEGVTCPLLATAPSATVTPLALERFRAARGFIVREGDL
jgi:tRNA(Ile)-lysidine synthase